MEKQPHPDDLTAHIDALREAFPQGRFTMTIRCELPESEPGAGDATSGNLALAGSSPAQAVEYLLRAQLERVEQLKEQAKAARQAQQALQAIHKPTLIMPGQSVPDAALIRQMHFDKKNSLLPPGYRQ